MSQMSKKSPISDPTFDLVSILYHALEGAETYDKYIQDAASSGHSDLEQFFRDVQQEENRRGERAKTLLAKYLNEFGSKRRAA